MAKNPPKSINVTNAEDLTTTQSGKTGQNIQTTQGEIRLTNKGEFLPIGYSGEIQVEVWNFKDKNYGKLINYDRSQGTAPAQSPAKSGNKDRLIVAQVAYKALVGADQVVNDGVLSEAVDMIMRVGEGKTEEIPY